MRFSIKQHIYFFASICICWGVAANATDNAEKIKTANDWTYKPHYQNRYQLCEDFLQYLNRKPYGYYGPGLKPDPLFKDFRLPRMTKVTKDTAYPLIKSQIYDHNGDKEGHFDLTQKNKSWEGFYSKQIEVANNAFYNLQIDMNHDGNVDNLLLWLTPFSKDIENYPLILASYVWLDKNNEYVSTDLFRVKGHPFLFQGRIFLAHIHLDDVFIREPSLEPGERDNPNKVWAGINVCTFYKSKSQN